jgi:small GTP-binding protein
MGDVYMTDIIQIAKKILLIGDPAVGKTSLIRRFVLDIFDDSYLSTLGTKVTNKTMILSLPEINQKVELKLMIWDVMGQKEYAMIQESAYMGSNGAIIVGDLSRQETLGHLGNWVSDLYNITSVIPLVFIGNKVDLIDPSNISRDELEKLAMSYEAPLVYTSAKSGENVENMFQIMAKLLTNASLEEISGTEME